MSDNEGGKKSGYRLEYASSARAKCNGEPTSSSLLPILHTLNHIAFHASFSRPRPEAVCPSKIVYVSGFYSRSRRCKGTAIGKGELRFGSLVDFRGNTSLYVVYSLQPHNLLSCPLTVNVLTRCGCVRLAGGWRMAYLSFPQFLASLGLCDSQDHIQHERVVQ